MVLYNTKFHTIHQNIIFFLCDRRLEDEWEYYTTREGKNRSKWIILKPFIVIIVILYRNKESNTIYQDPFTIMMYILKNSFILCTWKRTI